MSGKLTDVAIRNAKPGPKPCRMFDGGDLYLEISPAGGKLWRLKYRFGGKEKRLSLGAYPEVPLSQAAKDAPKGNRNAWKHGRYSAEAIARRRRLRALLREMQETAKLAAQY
ncbi:MAG: hypothetical protein AUJ49_01395 [Desulfovibrionaceae bacterium CG1_02_65_16]|nr:MAG: hypothetical protein AUJ49_01395 [Desulfovibrionaceae bacterium CG1_02_65_16]